MSNKDIVSVGAKDYAKMQRELSKLYALEAGGVDNWEWYDESLDAWRKENAVDDLIGNLSDELIEFIGEVGIDADVDFPGGYECGPNVHVTCDHSVAEEFIKGVISKYKELEANQ